MRGVFQFTHPVWGATILLRPLRICSLSFNSRTPCGVRLTPENFSSAVLKFQFTHPVWGATPALSLLLSHLSVSIHAPRVGCDCRITQVYWRCHVSIHAPRVGCDRLVCNLNLDLLCFNSRTPCGVRLLSMVIWCSWTCFNSRTPCGVRHVMLMLLLSLMSFNSRTPCGVRPLTFIPQRHSESFNSRTPCGVRQCDKRTKQ